MEALNMKGLFNVSFDKKAYDLEYHKKHLVEVKLKLNADHDRDIISWLSTKDNKMGYLKTLIRNDMRKEGANDHGGEGNAKETP